MKVAYQGAPGAFSHQACLAFLPDHEPMPEPSFAAVIGSLVAGRARRAILPLRNAAVGPVPGVRELIEEAPVRQLGEHSLAVRLHLLGLPDTRLEQVAVAVSHPMALRQCRHALARLGLRAEEAGNTALAARDLNDGGKAVLASEAAAQAYGLKILAHDLQDDPDNRTVFAVLAAASAPATPSS